MAYDTLAAEATDAPRLLNKAAVCRITGLTPRAIDNRIRAGTFPRGVPNSARQALWVAAEVHRWVDDFVARGGDGTGLDTAKLASIREARRRGGIKAQAILRERSAAAGGAPLPRLRRAA